MMIRQHGHLRRRSRRLLQGVRARFTTPSSSTSSSSSTSASTSASTRKDAPKSRQSLFEWYSDKLETHPITTKCITAGFISSFGNVLAQRITHEKDVPGGMFHSGSQDSSTSSQHPEHEDFQIDWDKTGRFALLNIAFVTPLLHYWYQFINKAVPGTSLSRVLQRVFWDEIVFTPVYVPAFMGSLWTLEGKDLSTVWSMVQREWAKLVMAEWTVWIPTMFITFRYVPVKFQVLTINCVGVFWSTFLSFMSTEAHKSAAVAATTATAEGTSDQEEVTE
eukprot:CAMPEP_0119552000 /NCGR_PEP_ID=MMETSP1352-20130426/5114_1 /TAXON_ID=265584 /ORGANISM="Stauroneis constricta, Strain CCMP1120" /LENGTH=276 /DNA_ID=CAMNT_0007598155 /DNA_START=38 /DNA_END=868 /DNA_ORIENTATION=+